MTFPARPGVDTGRFAVAGAAVLAGAAVAGLAATGLDPLLLIAAAAALAGAALMVLDERWAVASLAGFVVLHIPKVATDYHGAPSLFAPLAGAILLGIAARWLLTGVRPPQVAAIAVVVAAYVLVAAGSLLFADMPVDLGDTTALVKDAAVAVLAGLLVSRASTLRVAIWAMVGSGAFLAAVSVVQFLTGSFDSAFAGFGQSSIENIVGTYDDVRISGPIGDPNFYGQLLVSVLPLALNRMWAEPTLRLRLVGAGAAALIAAATVFTFSRGAAVALGAVAIIMLVIHRPSLRSVAAVAVCGVLAIPILPQGYLDRLLTLGEVGTVEGSTDASIRGRTAELTAGWLMFGDRPLTGVGFGLYEDHYQEYVAGLGIELRSEAREAHSFVLEVAAETGLLGLAAMGAVVGGAVLGLRRARRRSQADGREDLAQISAALLASITGFLITSLFLHHDFSRIFWLLMGLSYAVAWLATREPATAAVEEAAR